MNTPRPDCCEDEDDHIWEQGEDLVNTYCQFCNTRYIDWSLGIR